MNRCEISGTTATANLLAGNLDEYFQRTDSAGARSFLTDALGSTLALTDSTGTAQTSYIFEPFGNTTVTGTATTNSFAFTGRELDPAGLYFFRARYYSPTLQRFISEDPLGLRAGPNTYAYAWDSPVNLIDPLGLESGTTYKLEYDSLNSNPEPPMAPFNQGGANAPNPLNRPPDYINMGLSYGYGSVQFTCDSYGKCYAGAGPTKGVPIAGANISGGWLNQNERPDSKQLCEFLIEHNFSVAGGFILGGGETYTPGSGTSAELGIYTPQFGGTYHYSKKLGGRQCGCY